MLHLNTDNLNTKKNMKRQKAISLRADLRPQVDDLNGLLKNGWRVVSVTASNGGEDGHRVGYERDLFLVIIEKDD